MLYTINLTRLRLFTCNFQIQGGTGPVLITKLTKGIVSCEYHIIWRTGHACPNNDVITDKCQFSNGEVSFDLKKLEKHKKEMSYKVTATGYEYRIKVCSNGQSCGTCHWRSLIHCDLVLSRVHVASES